MPVTSGQFGTGSTGDSIEGQFYGPNHEEVGGIFGAQPDPGGVWGKSAVTIKNQGDE